MLTSLRSPTRRPSVRRSAVIGASIGAGLAATTSAAAFAVATYFARQLVTPEKQRAYDARVLMVRHGRDGQPTSIVVAPTVESQAPGRYGLLWDGDQGHARIGDVLGRTEDGNVVRRVDAVTRGELAPGPARWTSYYVDGSPDVAYGYPTEQVDLETELGSAPMWVTRSGDGTRWAILVHGRGATRGETLRAVPVLHRLGITAAIPSYRNDHDGPVSLDGRYALGLTEWRDVDRALAYAKAHGAQRADLLGWSMGGAIVMQVLARSELAHMVDRVVLDSPVLDWADVMVHHARVNKLNPRLATLASWLLGHESPLRRLVGVKEPVDVRLTNWVARADELTHPMLVIHSVDDEFVPYGPSAALARARPELVRWERWDTARHVREWNTDPDRWERVVSDYLTADR